MTATTPRVGAIVVAAGSSTRMGFDKIWATLGDRPVVAWGVSALADVSDVDTIVLVVSPVRFGALDLHKVNADVDSVMRHARPDQGFVVSYGGCRRRDSVLAGIEELRTCEWIVIHDGARPFISADLVERGLDAARETGAAIAALPVRETVKRVSGRDVVETLPRSELWTVQTPQVFRRDLLIGALQSSDDDVTDEATLVERMGGTVRVFEGSPTNLKITLPDDLELARALLRVRGCVSSP